MDKDEELKRLMTEQARDMRFGAKVWPEFSGTVSLDKLKDMHVELDAEGHFVGGNYYTTTRNAPHRTGLRRNRRHGTRCKKHPNEGRRSPKGKAYCNGCRREYARKMRGSSTVDNRVKGGYRRKGTNNGTMPQTDS